MKLTPNISIHEAAELLRDALQKKYGETVEAVIISSYGRARQVIVFDARLSTTPDDDGVYQPVHRWQQIGDFTHYTRTDKEEQL